MLPIVDKPTLQYIIEEAIESGIEEILIVTGRSKKSIEDHFDRSVELELELEQKGKKEMLKMVQDISNMVNIHYIRQKEPKGLGHAIHCAKSFIGNEPFAVLLGDDIVDAKVPCLKQLINTYDEYKTTVLGVQEVAKEDTDKYGILDVKHIEDRVYKVKDMVEKPSVEEAPSNIAILGRYIITPEIFNILENQEPGKGGEIQLTDALQTLATKEAIYAYNFLENQEPGKGGEIQLTDALQTLATKEAIYAYNFEGRRYDVGDKLGFLEATVDFALKRPELRDADALQTLATKEAIYAYNFEGRRYDVGDKLGFLEATVDFALKRPELRDEFMEFLKNKVGLKELVENNIEEAAITFVKEDK